MGFVIWRYVMTNNKLIELVYNGSNPLLKREGVTHTYAQAETIVYGDLKHGRVTCRKSVEGWMLNKRVELPTSCSVDLILKPTWRNYVRQVEVNLTGIFSLEMIMHTSTGHTKWDNGFGLADFGCVVSKGKHANIVLIDEGVEVIIARINYKKQGYEFSAFALNQYPHLMGQILKRSREIVELSRGKRYGVMPVHPDWIVAEVGAARYNLMLVEDIKAMAFARILFDRMGGFATREDRAKALLRIGKDILSAYIGATHTVRLLVLADRMLENNGDWLCDDGSITLRETASTLSILPAGTHGLVKGVGHNAAGHTFVVKGRAKVNDSLGRVHPDANAMLATGVDGWMRMGVVKFANVEPGTVVTVELGLTKDERYEERDAYALNTAALYVADLDTTSQLRLGGWLRRSAKRVARDLTGISSKLTRTLVDGFEAEEGSAVLNGRMAKYMLGFTGTLADDRNGKWLQTLTQKASSVKESSVTRAGICFSDRVAYAENVDGIYEYRVLEVPVDGFLMSEGLAAVVEEFKGEPCTMLRYPVLMTTSYLAVEPAAVVPGFAGRFMFAHPVAAAYLGGDDDDWGNLVFGIASNIKPSDGLACIDKHCPSVSMESINPETAYVWGMANQAMVGAYTNALHEAVLFGANSNDGDAMLIAQSVQALVQGVKKPNRPVISYARAKAIASAYREAAQAITYDASFRDNANLWTITHKTSKGMEKLEALTELYDFPAINVEKPLTGLKTATLTADEESVVTGVLASFTAGTVTVKTLNRALVDALVTMYGITLDTAVKADFDRLAAVYYVAYTRVYATAKNADLAIENANGALLWWGATLA